MCSAVRKLRYASCASVLTKQKTSHPKIESTKNAENSENVLSNLLHSAFFAGTQRMRNMQHLRRLGDTFVPRHLDLSVLLNVA